MAGIRSVIMSLLGYVTLLHNCILFLKSYGFLRLLLLRTFSLHRVRGTLKRRDTAPQAYMITMLSKKEILLPKVP